ncbi:MAG: CoA pyrophosphatase [Candidatus Krumholzibacteriota bacterium]|nr:CoA pyrophosphatase [Candidatus Krumholzibacteriota bacterium]
MSLLRAEDVAALMARRLPPAGPPAGDDGILPAAVLVPLLPVAGEAALLFTRRTRTLPDHKGQVSFPGGVREAGDSDLLATALRESAEEVGVDPARVRPLGALAPVVTWMEKYRVQPFLSLWPPGPYAPASPGEVARVFTVPLAALLPPAALRQAAVEFEGRRIETPAFLAEGEVIWGTTRRITQDLLARLRSGLAEAGLWP